MSLVHAIPAQAEDVKLQSLDGAVTFTGTYGLTFVKANELVYQGKRKVSQLIWESSYINTIGGAVTFDLPRDFYVRTGASIGFEGDGYMADFDWFNTRGPWTHRSQHEDTRLVHYFTIHAEAGRQFALDEETNLDLGVGFKYIDVKWTAWGGRFVYSDQGFRDWRGTFAPDDKGISYRQIWPIPYVGASLSRSEGGWTFTGGLQGGLTVDAYDIDDHWMRSLRFYDHFEAAPVVSLSGSVSYEIRENASLYLGGSLDRVFRARGDTKMIDTTSDTERWFRDGAGGDYQSMTVSFGLKGRF